MKKHSALTFVTTALALLVACSGDDSQTQSVSPDAVCDDGAKTYCDRVNACAPFFVTIAYGDVATCQARFKINCPSTFSAQGTSQTTAHFQTCVNDVKNASCDDLLGRNLPASCDTLPGALADGAACGVNDQCKGKLCRLSAANTCGACSTVGAVGAACERNEDCDKNLACQDKKCVVYGKAGAACSKTQPCVQTLACAAGTCTTPLEAGAACTFVDGDNACNILKGLYCDPKTKVCANVGTGAAGDACGNTGNGVVLCKNGGNCKTPAAAVAGTCLAAAVDGAACNDADGPKCVSPARCVSGVCKITDPATCR